MFQLYEKHCENIKLIFIIIKFRSYSYFSQIISISQKEYLNTKQRTKYCTLVNPNYSLLCSRKNWDIIINTLFHKMFAEQPTWMDGVIFSKIQLNSKLNQNNTAQCKLSHSGVKGWFNLSEFLLIHEIYKIGIVIFLQSLGNKLIKFNSEN